MDHDEFLFRFTCIVNSGIFAFRQSESSLLGNVWMADFLFRAKGVSDA